MPEVDLLTAYNYDSFVPEKFMPWIRFGDSPALGKRGPDFPLWRINGEETSLSQWLRQHAFTVVEFGSFT